MSKDYRDTEYCKGYGRVLDEKKKFMDSFHIQHPCAEDIHAYVSKNDGSYKTDFIKIYNGKCAYCGASIKIIPKSMLEIDHFIPQSAACFASKADAGKISNIVLSCRKCNHNKSDFLIEPENRPLLHPDYDGIKKVFLETKCIT